MRPQTHSASLTFLILLLSQNARAGPLGRFGYLFQRDESPSNLDALHRDGDRGSGRDNGRDRPDRDKPAISDPQAVPDPTPSPILITLSESSSRRRPAPTTLEIIEIPDSTAAAVQPTSKSTEEPAAKPDRTERTEEGGPQETAGKKPPPTTSKSAESTISTAAPQGPEDSATPGEDKPPLPAVPEPVSTSTRAVSTDSAVPTTLTVIIPFPDGNGDRGFVPTSTSESSSPVPTLVSSTGTVNDDIPTINTVLPTETALVSPEVLAKNVAEAKAFNDLFRDLTAQSPCTSKQIGCIQGQIGICGAGGAFEIEECQRGTSCFALPMNNTEGVIVGCYDIAMARRLLGLPAETTATFAPVVTETVVVTAAPNSPSPPIQRSTVGVTTVLPAPIPPAPEAPALGPPAPEPPGPAPVVPPPQEPTPQPKPTKNTIIIIPDTTTSTAAPAGMPTVTLSVTIKEKETVTVTATVTAQG